MRICRAYTFPYGHRLQGHPGKCRNVHGHTARVNVEVVGPRQANGMVIDFSDLDKIIKPVIDLLDHSFIAEFDDPIVKFLEADNSKMFKMSCPPTSENISKVLYDLFQAELDLAKTELGVNYVKFRESQSSYAKYNYGD